MVQESLQAIFWTALAAFMLAVFIELWLRQKKIKNKSRETYHSKRIDKALAHIRKNPPAGGKITNDLWQEITGVSHATAYRDLDKLLEVGILKKRGRGRGIYYTLAKHS